MPVALIFQGNREAVVILCWSSVTQLLDWFPKKEWSQVLRAVTTFPMDVSTNGVTQCKCKMCFQGMCLRTSCNWMYNWMFTDLLLSFPVSNSLLLGNGRKSMSRKHFIQSWLMCWMQKSSRQFIVHKVLQTPTHCGFPCFVLRRVPLLFLVHLTLRCNSWKKQMSTSPLWTPQPSFKDSALSPLLIHSNRAHRLGGREHLFEKI